MLTRSLFETRLTDSKFATPQFIPVVRVIIGGMAGALQMCRKC